MTPLLRTLSLLLACLPMAQGAIIWSGIQDISIPATFGGVFVNLNTSDHFTSADPSFLTSDINLIFGGDGIASGARLLPARGGILATDLIIPVLSNSIVDGSLNFGPEDFGASQGHVGPGPTQFASGSEGYIAFKYDAADNGNYSYGWMRITPTNGSSEGVIHEWAFSDTPGESITVGTIPEPSLPALLTLGILLALRHRRP